MTKQTKPSARQPLNKLEEEEQSMVQSKDSKTQQTTFKDVADLFNSSPEFQGAVLPVSECQIFRGGAKTPSGLLIKMNSFQKMLWTSKKTPQDLGAWRGIVKFGGVKEEDVYIFQKPRFSIITVSPRVIEATLAKSVAATSNTKSLKLGVYSIPGEDGINHIIPEEMQKMKLIYEILAKNESVRVDCKLDKIGLRSFVLLMLVDPETNELLHQQPLCLSIKGLTAVDFGKMTNQVNAEFQVAVAQAGTNAKSLSIKALSALWIQPEFSVESGGGNNVEYAGITPTADGKLAVEWGFPDMNTILSRVELFDSIREQNKGFADKLMSYHRQVNGLWGDDAITVSEILQKVDDLIPSQGIIALPQSMSNSFILNGATDDDFDVPRLTSAPLDSTDTEVTIDTEALDQPPF